MTAIFFLTAGFALCAAVWVIRSRFAGFLAQRPDDYKTGPRFDPQQHLNGPILCEGVLYGPLGRVTSRFVARMDGTWQGDQGDIAEHFRYDSGKVQDRRWALKLGADGSLHATAPDVVGQGVGRVEGSAVVMRYRIRLDADAGGHVLDVTDWMYLLDNGTIMNRSQFRKFGIKVAELVATMRPMAA